MLVFVVVLCAYLLFAGALMFGFNREWWDGIWVITLHGVAGISFFIWTCWCSYPSHF